MKMSCGCEVEQRQQVLGHIRVALELGAAEHRDVAVAAQHQGAQRECGWWRSGRRRGRRSPSRRLPNDRCRRPAPRRPPRGHRRSARSESSMALLGPASRSQARGDFASGYCRGQVGHAQLGSLDNWAAGRRGASWGAAEPRIGPAARRHGRSGRREQARGPVEIGLRDRADRGNRRRTAGSAAPTGRPAADSRRARRRSARPRRPWRAAIPDCR